MLVFGVLGFGFSGDWIGFVVFRGLDGFLVF